MAVLILFIPALLKVYGSEVEAVREGESCVSYGGRLVEARICADVCRRTRAVNCRCNSLSCCVGACLFVGEDVVERGFVALCLVVDEGGGGRGWLDVWDIV